MIRVGAKILGLPTLKRTLEVLVRDLGPEHLSAEMKALAETARERLRLNTPPLRRPGRLKDSWYAKIEKSRNRIQIQLTTRLKYATRSRLPVRLLIQYLEKGVKPHDVEGVAMTIPFKNLTKFRFGRGFDPRFYTTGGGRKVLLRSRAHRVYTPATRFVSKTREEVEKIFQDRIRVVARKAVLAANRSRLREVRALFPTVPSALFS